MSEIINDLLYHIEWNDNRKNILIKLQELNEELSKKYVGAIRVLEKVDIPNRINLSAHCIRELMGMLPNYLDAPIKQTGPTLKNLAMNLREDWKLKINDTYLQPSCVWTDEIRIRINNFLLKCQAFFKQADGILRVKKEISRAMARIMTTGDCLMPIPVHIEDRVINAWKIYLDYFNSVAHHGATTQDEFIVNLTGLELILCDLMFPRTFKNMNEILKIINEGESNAN